MRGMKTVICLVLAVLLAVTAGVREPAKTEEEHMADNAWHFGFAKRQIAADESRLNKLYIAGYRNGVGITGILDLCEARSVWLDAGGKGILLIGVDCIALDSGTVASIREGLSDLPGCARVNVYSTHTHAGPDTLGLWGRIGSNGKDAAYMNDLIAAAVQAGREAATNVKAATLHYGKVKTSGMYRDSRTPEVYDENLYQLRFSALDQSAGLRLLFYGAHAESLRGDNTLLSRDYPGRLCDSVKDLTGDDAMFFPGAVGGLIMTRLFVSDASRQAVENMRVTADKLTAYALSVRPEDERELEPALKWTSLDFTVPLDNPVFMAYRFMGILNSRAVPAQSATGMGVQSELGVIMLDDAALVLIPGEIFPELVSGEAYARANPDGVNPRPLKEIAAGYGLTEFMIVGLCNDELGYIVPPSDFLLNEKRPYIDRITDSRGEDHYEETNSVGPACAQCIADAFELALQQMAE